MLMGLPSFCRDCACVLMGLPRFCRDCACVLMGLPRFCGDCAHVLMGLPSFCRDCACVLMGFISPAGMANLEFQLISDAKLGKWTIEVTVDGVQTTQHFKVDEYGELAWVIQSL